jgi:hypothetical protein
LTFALLLIGLLAAACETSTDTDPTSTLATTSSTVPESVVSNDRIVVSTITGAVVVHDVDGGVVVRFDPPDGHVYRQPTWLDASSVIFSEVSESGDHSLTAADADTGVILWRAPMETPPFFFAPSPTGGQRATTSLRNDPDGAGLIAELIGDNGDTAPLSDESPFYTSWSPDGASLAIHIAGQRLDVRQDGTTETILTNTGLFQTPVWIKHGLVTLRTVDGTQRLTSWSDGVFTDIAEVDGPVGFVAVGDLIAVQAVERPDAGSIAAAFRAQSLPVLPGGSLVVINLATASFQTVSDELALLYQWDRVGERLLFATLGDETLSLVWNVWSNGTRTELATFTLQPPWFRNLVPFFDQYAQSVQLWSSSGDHIGYPAVVDSRPVVVIERTGGGDSVLIEGATWAAWAPGR